MLNIVSPFRKSCTLDQLIISFCVEGLSFSGHVVPVSSMTGREREGEMRGLVGVLGSGKSWTWSLLCLVLVSERFDITFTSF